MTKKMKVVLEELDWLKRPTAQGEKIMFASDWSRLIEYSKVLVTKNEIPISIDPISGILYKGFMGKIRYSFYRIHCGIQGAKPRNNKYIEFLHKVFPGKFTGKLATTETKFSVPTKIP